MIKYLRSLKATAQEYRTPLQREWDENERFYSGDQWKGVQGRPVKNWCFSIVEGELPILLGNTYPSTDTVALQEDRIEDAKVLDSAIQSIYQTQNIFLKRASALRTALKQGTGYLYVDYDPELQRGQGDITIKNITSSRVFLDPSANELEDASFAII